MLTQEIQTTQLPKLTVPLAPRVKSRIVKPILTNLTKQGYEISEIHGYAVQAKSGQSAADALEEARWAINFRDPEFSFIKARNIGSEFVIIEPTERAKPQNRKLGKKLAKPQVK